VCNILSIKHAQFRFWNYIEPFEPPAIYCSLQFYVSKRYGLRLKGKYYNLHVDNHGVATFQVLNVLLDIVDLNRLTKLIRYQNTRKKS
jgi:hypothetical protein